MTVETLTRQQAEDERDHLASDLADEHGTADREELRDLTLSGALTFEQIARIERLDLLDYLTRG